MSSFSYFWMDRFIYSYIIYKMDLKERQIKSHLKKRLKKKNYALEFISI